MTRQEARTVTISCQAKDCPNQDQLTGDQNPADKGWGTVSLNIPPNGYTEVDLCRQHYPKVLQLFGLSTP